MQDRVRLDDGETLRLTSFFGPRRLRLPYGWKKADWTLPEGFVRVAPTLQTRSPPWIFSAGEVAAVQNRALPKSGVFAVRMAKPLERNLRAYLAGTPLSVYLPQRHSLSLIGTADVGAPLHRMALWQDTLLFSGDGKIGSIAAS